MIRVLLLAAALLAQDFSDPAVRSQLAESIYNSPLRFRLSQERERAAVIADLERWIAGNPDQARYLAMGFARDKQEGTKNFENALMAKLGSLFEHNPNRYKGILGVLTEASNQSKAIVDQEISDEEKRDLLKRVFEGEGPDVTQVLKGPMDSGAGSSSSGGGGPGGAIFAGSGLYDRLSAANIGGYSPDVLALQNALNLQQVPGAPKVPETGHLDYETLSHPYHALGYDIRRLETSLDHQRAWTALKRVNRGDMSYEELARDPAALRSMEEAGGPVPPRFLRRRTFLDRAKREIEQLNAFASRAKSIEQVTPELLRLLGSKQREAGRWITAASVEEELQRLETEEGFMTRELEQLIRTSPAPEETRRNYLIQGRKLKERLAKLKDIDLKVVALLETPGPFTRATEAMKLLESAKAARKDLSLQIKLFRTVPYELASAWQPIPRWKRFLHRWLKRLLPNVAYVKRIIQEERQGDVLGQAFSMISSGNYTAAGFLVAQTAGR